MTTIDVCTNDTSKIENIAKNHELAVICGSFISSYAPTNTPNGIVLTNVLFDALFANNSFVNTVLSGEEIEKIKNQFTNDLSVPFEMAFDPCSFITELKVFFKSYFSASHFNFLHRLFIDLLREKHITSVITPNYDCYISEAAYDFHELVTVYSEDQIPLPSDPVCFQIHGSVLDDNPGNLAVTMSDEKLMPEWKRKLLIDLLTDKYVLILGYSGRDFEICPELADMLQNGKIKGVLWNSKDGILTENAKIVLSCDRNGTINNYTLKGDIVAWLNVLFGKGIVNPGVEPNDFIKQFSDGISLLIHRFPSASILWVAGIMINMGWVKQAYTLLKNYEAIFWGDKSYEYNLAVAGCLYKQGKYKSAAQCYWNANKHIRKTSRADSLLLLLDLYEDCRTGKWYFKSILLAAYITVEMLFSFAFRKSSDQTSKLTARYFYRMAVGFRNLTLRLKCRKIFAPLFGVILKAGMKHAVKCGDRVLQQNFELEHETLQMSIQQNLSYQYKAKNTFAGYGELGNFFEEVISIRRSRTRELIHADAARRTAISEELKDLSEKCEGMGLYPEAYKCLAATQDKGLTSKIMSILQNNCEYSAFASYSNRII